MGINETRNTVRQSEVEPILVLSDGNQQTPLQLTPLDT